MRQEKVLKSNGTDLVYGDSGSIANVYYVSQVEQMRVDLVLRR